MLEELAVKYRTDKAIAKVGPLSAKGYTSAYEQFLSPMRQMPIRLLEIGVYDGASLRMWADYLPQARIFAIDIDPRCSRHATDRVQVFIGDQTDQRLLASVASVAGGFDAIIDDGGHRMEHHRASLVALWPYLEAGGWYAIEDMHTAYDTHFGGGPVGVAGSTMTDVKLVIDALAGGGRVALSTIVDDVESVHVYRSLVILVKGRPRRPESATSVLDRAASIALGVRRRIVR